MRRKRLADIEAERRAELSRSKLAKDTGVPIRTARRGQEFKIRNLPFGESLEGSIVLLTARPLRREYQSPLGEDNKCEGAACVYKICRAQTL